MRLCLLVGFAVLLFGVLAGITYWVLVGALLVAAGRGLIWRGAPITDRRSLPRSQRKRWIA